MRPVEFGEALAVGIRLTLVSDVKPERFFGVIRFWMDETAGMELALKTGVPSCQVEDEEGRIHLLINLPIEEENEGPLVPLACPIRQVFDSSVLSHG